MADTCDFSGAPLAGNTVVTFATCGHRVLDSVRSSSTTACPVCSPPADPVRDGMLPPGGRDVDGRSAFRLKSVIPLEFGTVRPPPTLLDQMMRVLPTFLGGSRNAPGTEPTTVTEMVQRGDSIGQLRAAGITLELLAGAGISISQWAETRPIKTLGDLAEGIPLERRAEIVLGDMRLTWGVLLATHVRPSVLHSTLGLNHTHLWPLIESIPRLAQLHWSAAEIAALLPPFCNGWEHLLRLGLTAENMAMLHFSAAEWSSHLHLTPIALAERLRITADDLGRLGWSQQTVDAVWGAGSYDGMLGYKASAPRGRGTSRVK